MHARNSWIALDGQPKNNAASLPPSSDGTGPAVRRPAVRVRNFLTIGNRRAAFVALALVLGLVAAAILSVPALRWRAEVVVLKLKGDIPDIPMTQLLPWLAPRSPVYLADLADKPSPDVSIHNLNSELPAFIERGAQEFQERCSSCHGADARGGAGPSLIAFVSRSTDWSFLSTAKWGRAGTAMAAQPLTDEQIWQVHAFLRAKTRVWLADAKARSHSTLKIDVPYAKIAAAEAHPDEWLTYSGDLMGHRHSRLAQINRHNLNELRVAWAAQLRPARKPLSATPIVAGGLMFVSEAPDGVAALDAKTGRLVWRFTRPIDPSKLPLCCGAFNRGVAILDNRVFVATLDAYLIALDASTGEKLWEIQVAPAAEGYSMTSAPLALDGYVLVGVAGGEYGIRGFVAAYSPVDGKRLWRFEAIPGPGKPGHETWAGDSWKTGGASTWAIGAYDKERDLVYWGIGNPWPPLDTRVREGDNLYSNSMVALERKTGKMRWYFQFTPADSHDWDATQQVILADINWKGRTVPALLMANRNGFYYILDRRDGRFLKGMPFVKQTWAKSVDEKGRPLRDPATLPSPKGTLVWPWMHGGTNWWPPSYDEKRKLHFVPTVDAATLYFSLDMKYKNGDMTMGGTTQLATNQPAVMAVKAFDPETGQVRWSTRLDHGDFEQYARLTGLVSTDGGIVVAGFMDRMSILDSDTGKELWKFRPGGLINAGAITYAVDGVQYIAVVAGNVLFAFSIASAN
jgi:alcohol dehydrogenase (cytochrome c)